MNHKILGRDWKDIQAAQQGNSAALNKPLSGPPIRPTATDADRELLAKHGLDGLKEMGFFGVIDRLSKTMNETMRSDIKSAFYQVFPDSYISISNAPLSGKSMYIKCFLQKPGEWTNDISDNDPLNYLAEFNHNTNVYIEHYQSILIKPDNDYLVYGSAKLRKRTIKNADITKIKARFIQLKKFIINNLDKTAHDISAKVKH